MKTITKVFWLFGRSGAGKTTLALRLRDGLATRKIPVCFFDGDEMRSGLCADLGFDSQARVENHRRIAEVARLMAEQGCNVVVSTMAPQYDQRDVVAGVLQQRLVWFYVHAPIDVCIQRDPKGLYQRAQSGKLDQLINYPFDVPRPQERENYIHTVAQNVEECFQSILETARSHICDYAI